jgi:hypothetical protein
MTTIFNIWNVSDGRAISWQDAAEQVRWRQVLAAERWQPGIDFTKLQIGHIFF